MPSFLAERTRSMKEAVNCCFFSLILSSILMRAFTPAAKVNVHMTSLEVMVSSLLFDVSKSTIRCKQLLIEKKEVLQKLFRKSISRWSVFFVWSVYSSCKKAFTEPSLQPFFAYYILHFCITCFGPVFCRSLPARCQLLRCLGRWMCVIPYYLYNYDLCLLIYVLNYSC